MWNTLLAVSVVLVDHNEGDGGFCVVRGSHKLNFPVPPDMATGEALSENVFQPVTRAGALDQTIHFSITLFSS